MSDESRIMKNLEVAEHYTFYSPEKRLFCAVLNRAIMDAVGEAEIPPEHKKKARVWLFLERDPLPFQIDDQTFGTLFWYCNALDLEWKSIVTYARSFINNPKKRMVLQRVYLDKE